MLPRDVKVGYVLNYAYLWHRQHLAGREEGAKDRPSLVLALVEVDENGVKFVRVLPMTHAPPARLEEGVEIPSAVKRRLRLDHERSWIVLTESNRFAWPGPDLRAPSIATSDGYFGPLPPELFARVKRGFVSLARSGRHASVPRTK